jgi:hypothetical protein
MDLTGKRFAIIGTAQSWKQAPWTDTGLVIASLNDAYRLAGFQRADLWFDFHPLDRFYHVPEGQKQIFAHQIPPGHYVRPPDHLAWLGRQQIPIYLHPEYLTQHPPAADWTHAHAFPKAEVEAYFGRYFTSSPGWMLALAILRGARDISIYGIHLATEFEYIQQRPNLEFLIGRVLGPKRVAVTVADGMRHYTTPDGHVALPEASPVLQADFQYAFDQRPDAVLEPVKWELHKLQVKHTRKLHALRSRPWYSPWATEVVPADGTTKARAVRVSASTLQRELVHLEAAMDDRQQEMHRLQAGR